MNNTFRKSELPGDSAGMKRMGSNELSGRHELEGTQRPAELPADGEFTDLPELIIARG